MGGNLFKLGRLPKSDYQKVETTLKPFLDKTFGSLYRIPRYYASKPDFGDLDIIVSSNAFEGNWEKVKANIIVDLQLKEFKSVGHVFSTNFMNFQVDYFTVGHQYFESTYNFMCFNDLGNILGKMFRRFNLKYGEEGLLYVYRRDDGHYKKDLPVSQNMEKIVGFLGLSYEQWVKGFDTLDDMFSWAIQSPYFSVKPFVEPSKVTEQRIETRTTIQRFVQWLEEHQITKTYEYLEDRDQYLPMINEYFPESQLDEQIKREQIREEEVKIMNEKFNGNVVMELTGLSGKELGAFIVRFKSQFNDFEDFLLQTDKSVVQNRIVELWKTPES
ncbi:hypothetical protein QNI16_06615 [Cytophagaceae bacterium YF14B1]|uniref:Uncharacterized protein n=1 Tax=Xanthocytophaga flava TaxID=3048013 RepID=A0AAE3U4X5_9BACT|nr:hypothetical protein [Xanthocytophaga flavus]MDJ1480149.1 hypothetical protein [Xanthocytophaga flavus]